MDSRRTASESDTPDDAISSGDDAREEARRQAASVAERLVTDLSPSTVLDVGCGAGWRVADLRERGVVAQGVVLAAGELAAVAPDAALFCHHQAASSVADRQWDLILCLDVIDRLEERDAAALVAGICHHTHDVLFAATPFNYADLDRLNIRPPDHWAAMFAEHGFVRDVDYDASYVAPWAMRFRPRAGPLAALVAGYERRMWQLGQERHARRDLALQLHHELARTERRARRLRDRAERLTSERDDMAESLVAETQKSQVLEARVQAWENRWRHLESSMAWGVVQRLQRLRSGLAPVGGRRERWLVSLFWWHRLAQRGGLGVVARQLRRSLGRKARAFARGAEAGSLVAGPGRLAVAEIVERPPVRPRGATVDIVICVHNALDDVRQCLASVERHTDGPYRLILVDDGSTEPAAAFLADFAKRAGAELLRNAEARGYTRAANQGMARSAADFVVLLNSDTLVTRGWLDRLVACAESDPRIGAVGPLSNTASWQSIPEVFSGGDWAANRLPPDVSTDEMAQLVAASSSRLYPELPFLNGFCLMLKRGLIEAIGTFDEGRFGEGYGEENDYALRARAAGWRLAVADDAYVYHAQSKSYSDERRRRLYERADAALAKKHGQQVIDEGVAACRDSAVLAGIRARAAVLLERRDIVAEGRELFAGRRVAFLLPVDRAGGGANIITRETRAMQAMGVEVSLLNYRHFKTDFEAAYPDLGIPVLYGPEREMAAFVAERSGEFDALVASLWASVEVLRDVSRQLGTAHLAYGYYIQDFEPYFFPPGSDMYHRAWQSYALLPNLVRVTKTEWNQRELAALTGADSSVVGPSFDSELFRPRPRAGPEPPDRPLRIVAMIRPESTYRAPRLTMEVLRDGTRQLGGNIDVWLFGCEAGNPAFVALPRDFRWRLAGVLNPRQTARLLSEADVFVDFSSHQAMGLTGLEAMACGLATVLPVRGGAAAFGRHGENCLLVDTASAEACLAALGSLVVDSDLRLRLQRNALADAPRYFPERPALKILRALFARSAADA